MGPEPEKPDPNLGHGPRRLRGVLALLASSVAGGVTGLALFLLLKGRLSSAVMHDPWGILGGGTTLGLLIGFVMSLIVLAFDAQGRGPRTLWGWVLVGFHAPVAAFLLMGFLSRGT